MWGVSPAFFHLTNLLLIATSAALVVAVARRYTGDARLAALAYLAEAQVRRLSYAGVFVAASVVVTVGVGVAESAASVSRAASDACAAMAVSADTSVGLVSFAPAN